MLEGEGVKGGIGPRERFTALLPRQEEDVARLAREVRDGDADPADLAVAQAFVENIRRG